MAFITDSNRPQPLRQPPPTACLTASGAASEAPSLPNASLAGPLQVYINELHFWHHKQFRDLQVEWNVVLCSSESLKRARWYGAVHVNCDRQWPVLQNFVRDYPMQKLPRVPRRGAVRRRPDWCTWLDDG